MSRDPAQSMRCLCETMTMEALSTNSTVISADTFLACGDTAAYDSAEKTVAKLQLTIVPMSLSNPKPRNEI